MENLDALVLRTLRDWRRLGKHAVLVTVIRTWGSSPRPVGSIMALCTDGSVCGSVSGGCIEDDLISLYCRPHGEDTSFFCEKFKLTTYGIAAEEAHRFGLPCGGTLELALEFDPEATGLERLVAMLDEGKLVRRVLSINDGTVELAQAALPHQHQLSFNAERLVNTFGPGYRMLLIGAGQLTEYVATMALFCGFRVTVCDPRPEYQSNWGVKGVDVISEMPDDAVRSFILDQRSCVIALTHDPKLDELALLEALQSGAFYVGAIGSRKNAQARRDRMKRYFDHTDESLELLRGPIGVFIGSKTPPEIAVSIMAEVIAVRNAIRLPRSANVAEAKASLETSGG